MNRFHLLKANRLRNDAHCVTVGREIIVLEQIGSTNDVVRAMAAGDWPEGLVVFAEHQTAGRGQRGNRWESAAHKGLWFSILLEPQLAIQESARLTRWAAQAIAATIESHCSLKAWVKQPNDVYVATDKVAGVLLEMCARPAAPHAAILGIGVNVNQSPSDFSKDVRDRATSLAIIRRGRLSRHEFAVDLLQNLDRTYAEVVGRSFDVT